jgi:hypothetical protein
MLVAATHIDPAFLISSFFILSRYFAIRMPAGHNMPPHPAARSSCKSSGGSSSPPKSMDLMLAGMCSGDLTKSSPKARNSCSGEGDREAIEGDMIRCYLLSSVALSGFLYGVEFRVFQTAGLWGRRFLPCRRTNNSLSWTLPLRDTF